MANDQSLVILSVDTLSSSVSIEVKHHNKRRRINALDHLSLEDFNRLKPLLLDGPEARYADSETFPLVSEIVQLQYAISLLREYTVDFSVLDIVTLYRNNKALLMPVSHLKKLLRCARSLNRRSDVKSYSSLLKQVLAFSPDSVFMDVTMMKAGWFQRFREYLKNQACSEKEASDSLHLLWEVYVATCREGGAKVVYSPDDPSEERFQAKDFVCHLTESDVERLSVEFVDEELLGSRNLLLLRHWITGIALVDLLDLKMEDIHHDGVWYRRRSDNRLCFIGLPFNIVCLIRQKLGTGDNRLLKSPYDDMENARARLELKQEWYAGQLDKICRQFHLSVNWI